MPTFPAIAPSSRSFTPGEYPHAAFTALSGEQSRVRHSDAVVGGSVDLTFTRLTEDERSLIEQHYLGQQGEFLAFSLPPETFSGFDPYDFLEGAGLWRYAEPPEIEDFCGPHHDVRVRLVAVPGGASGADLGPITLGIQGGAAVPAANGMTGTLTLSLTPGAGSATTPLGSPLLLMHMEGSGQTFTDSSTYNRTISVNNYGSSTDPTQSTDQAKFGSKSAYFPSGYSDVSATDLGLGTTSAYTVELFFWIPSSWSSGSSGSSTLILCSGPGFVYYDRTQGLWMELGSSSAQTYLGTLAADTWHYIKWTRATSQVLRRFLNGSEVYTSATAYNLASFGTFRLGRNTFGEADNSWRGYIDEVRISPGIDNSLSVPTAAFPNP